MSGINSSWWLNNPSEKIWSSNVIISPKRSGVQITKMLELTTQLQHLMNLEVILKKLCLWNWIIWPRCSHFWNPSRLTFHSHFYCDIKKSAISVGRVRHKFEEKKRQGERVIATTMNAQGKCIKIEGLSDKNIQKISESLEACERSWRMQGMRKSQQL